MLHEDKRIRYSCIEQEGVDVFVKLPALCSAAIVATKLVSSIYSPHELIVADDTLGTGDRNPRSVLQSSEDSSHTSWLTDDMTITTFRSIHALADTFPFWTVSESSLRRVILMMQVLTTHKVLSK